MTEINIDSETSIKRNHKNASVALVAVMLWLVIVSANMIFNPNSKFSTYWIVLGGILLPFAMYLIMKFGDEL